MKYRIYIDEVGNSDLKSSANTEHRFLCLTGVIFELDYVRTVLQPQLEALKEKYFGSHPDDPLILHRKELMYKKFPFHALADTETEKAFNTEYLQLVTSWNYTVISVIIDKQEHNNNYDKNWKYDPYHYCQEVLLDRFRLFLKTKDAVGDVMIESRGGREDIRLKKSFRNLMESGTNFLTAEELQESITSKELKVKVKEANVAGLQIADLLAHSVRRYAFKTLFQMDDGKQTFSDNIISILEESKFFRLEGKINSYGIKKLP
jgi:hypothetical protein